MAKTHWGLILWLDKVVLLYEELMSVVAWWFIVHEGLVAETKDVPGSTELLKIPTECSL